MIVADLFARLGFKIDRSSARQANRTIGGMATRLGQASRQADGLFSSIRRAAVGFVGFAAVARAGGGLLRTIHETERLRAVMEGVMGSAEAAEDSFDFILDFTTATPFQVDQVTEAFIRLNGAGIEPTTELLTEVGDFAATFGANIADMIEGIQNAGRGMPKMLEGIIRADIDAASAPGKLRILFRGVQYEIDRSTEAVLDFIRMLGRDQFAGQMDRQMRTIVGAWSNFGDMITATHRRIGDVGLTDALTRLLFTLIETGKQSEDLADSFGRFLARQVDRATDSIIWLRENADDLRIALMLLGSAGVIRAIRTLGLALMSTLRPINLLMAALVTLPLIIDDVLGFLEGRPSVMELMIGDKDQVGNIRGGFQRFGQMMSDIFEPITRIAESLFTIGEAAIQPILHLFGAVMGAIEVPNILEALAFALDKVAWVLDKAAGVIEFMSDKLSALIDLIRDLVGWIPRLFGSLDESPMEDELNRLMGREPRSFPVEPEPTQAERERTAAMFGDDSAAATRAQFGHQSIVVHEIKVDINAPTVPLEEDSIIRGFKRGAETAMETVLREAERTGRQP